MPSLLCLEFKRSQPAYVLTGLSVIELALPASTSGALRGSSETEVTDRSLGARGAGASEQALAGAQRAL